MDGDHDVSSCDERLRGHASDGRRHQHVVCPTHMPHTDFEYCYSALLSTMVTLRHSADVLDEMQEKGSYTTIKESFGVTCNIDAESPVPSD